MEQSNQFPNTAVSGFIRRRARKFPVGLPSMIRCRHTKITYVIELFISEAARFEIGHF